MTRVPAERKLPLSGLRVLDFGHIVAGPYCARLLADLGAEVVKVETATRQGRTGARRGGTRRADASGRTPHLAHINRNRRSIDLNLKTERGLAIARRLVDVADVLVENFSSGVMDRLGLGYRELAASNPRLVYASMSSFGHTGPRAGWTGMNVTLQACSGLMLATGAEGDPPIGISNSWNDYIGGLHAAVAILGALDKRKATGAGCFLDVSQFEGSVAMVGSLLLACAVTHAPPARLGSRSLSAAPQGCYRCAGADQWCAISVQSDAQWQALVAELGDDAAPLRAPRLATLAGRLEQHDAIDRVLSAWTGARAPADVERRLEQRGVPAAAMRRGNELADTAEWQRLLLTVETTGMRVIGPPFAFRASPAVAAVAAPRMGADGGAVLRDWLKLDDAAIAGLFPEIAA
ncbi:MAG TPA: CoA transferase [Stellaceae bacterium]|nr:CoA transferase [Stellaceae bacterium]